MYEHTLIGLDWGTSSLRATLFDSTGHIDQLRHRPWGIRQLPEGGFAAALTQITADWPMLPILACGMIGSRDGWHEVPYLNLPTTPAEVGWALARINTTDHRSLYLIPGLRDQHGPDVMRGEETQLTGTLALRPELATASTCILPGTHSKWVLVREGRITAFHTLMTGELFALLQRHSILATGAAISDDEAFMNGVLAARHSGAKGAFSQLFSIRTLMLEGTLAESSVSSYLSGLLIGEEFRIALEEGWTIDQYPVQLIGDATLCQHYHLAARGFGIELDAPLEHAASTGLWQIARCAGLIRSTP